MSILERLRDPALLDQMSLGEKLWGAVIVMIIGMVACLVALTAIMYAIKLMHLLFRDRKQVPAAAAAAAAPAGEEAAVRLPDPRAFAAGSVVVSSPCAGQVTALNARVGASVRAGDVLLLLRAFQSENELLAPEDGVVAELRVAQGDQVGDGQVLAVLRGEGA